MSADRGEDQAVSPAAILRLEDWLRSTLPNISRITAITEFVGGQSNPTYRIETPTGWYALRRKPFGTLLPKAHAVEREFRVLRALNATGVATPTVYALCEDSSIIGTSFYVMAYLEGRIFRELKLAGLKPPERVAIFDAMNAMIARLHRVPPAQVGLADFGRSDGYMGRQIARWTSQYRAAQTENIEAMERVIEWLPRQQHAERPGVIVHGDYKIDNIVFDLLQPRILGVLDWELSTLGDPIADFAYHVMVWRVPSALFNGVADLALDALGIPHERDYLAAYLERTGFEVDPHAWAYYVTFSLFKLASVLQGIAKRAQIGTANSPDAVEIGRRARPVAELAWNLARSTRP